MTPALGPVLVIGTGLIGTSVALALRASNVDVLLEDLSVDHAKTAESMGAGRLLRPDDAPHLVVVAVPPRHAGRAMAEAARRFPEATITDVTSVKAPVLAEAVALGADPARLVGGHPMAGREVAGAAAARADILTDRWWILTPSGDTDDDRLRQVHRLVTACGAFAIQMSAQDHDRAVALVSHAPQLLSSTLAAQLVGARDEHVRVAGQGLRDMTRIAASDSSLWTDILTVNAEQVADVLEGVVADLSEQLLALRAVADGRADQAARVTAELVEGAAGRARIPGKHGATAAAFADVEVTIADRPGEMARLFTAVSETSVNLEDMRIEHVLGRPSGVVLLSVRPEAAPTLVAALRDRGFDAH